MGEIKQKKEEGVEGDGSKSTQDGQLSEKKKDK